MNREWVVDVVARLPQGMVSRAWGWLARRRHPRAGVALLKRGFVAATGIDLREAAEPISSYRTLEDLFIRPLKAGARRIDPAPDAVVSPVDGTVGASGVVEQGTALQLKKRRYSVAKLFGSAAEAERFEGGHFLTFYLSPKDYHRVHAPLAGRVQRARVIPGALMPVFHESLVKVDELFARNERLITFLEDERVGRFAVVKVGATLVGRISVAYDESLRSNDPSVSHLDRDYPNEPKVQKGGELGAFELGSTVVLFFEKGAVRLEGLEPGQAIRLGERVATIRKATRAETTAPQTASQSPKKKSPKKKVSKKKESKTKVSKTKKSPTTTKKSATAKATRAKKTTRKTSTNETTKKKTAERSKTTSRRTSDDS